MCVEINTMKLHIPSVACRAKTFIQIIYQINAILYFSFKHLYFDGNVLYKQMFIPSGPKFSYGEMAVILNKSLQQNNT